MENQSESIYTKYPIPDKCTCIHSTMLYSTFYTMCQYPMPDPIWFNQRVTKEEPHQNISIQLSSISGYNFPHKKCRHKRHHNTSGYYYKNVWIPGPYLDNLWLSLLFQMMMRTLSLYKLWTWHWERQVYANRLNWWQIECLSWLLISM